MERLTIRDKNGEAHMICKQMCGDYGHQCDGQVDVDMCQRYVAFDKLAEYEDLEEQGLLLKLPCKVGDTVYLIKSDGKVVPRTADMQFLGVLWDDYGKKWFLTQEEAEEKLKESGG